MAFTKRLVESFMQTARSSTSGYQDDDDINRNIAMIDNELMETFAPLYAINGKVQDLLKPFVKKGPQAVVAGVLSTPANYVQYIDSSYKGTPIYPRNINEISILETSPIRKPKLEGPCFVSFSGGTINYHPKEINSVELSFIERPLPGVIKFNVVSTEDSDYITTEVTREILWPERAFNLFYYHLLEKYGIEQDSQLAAEYSQLGINREITKV